MAPPSFPDHLRPESEGSRTLTLTLSSDQAWLIHELLPGAYQTYGVFGEDVFHDLRKKITNALLRFADEKGLREIPIPISEGEGWLIDQAVKYDGPGGLGTSILTQLFRGLWELDNHLPGQLVEDPRSTWSHETFRERFLKGS